MSSAKPNRRLNQEVNKRLGGGLHSDRAVLLSEFETLFDELFNVGARNGISLSNDYFELGANPLIHDTVLDQDGYSLNLSAGNFCHIKESIAGDHFSFANTDVNFGLSALEGVISFGSDNNTFVGSTGGAYNIIEKDSGSGNYRNRTYAYAHNVAIPLTSTLPLLRAEHYLDCSGDYLAVISVPANMTHFANSTASTFSRIFSIINYCKEDSSH